MPILSDKIEKISFEVIKVLFTDELWNFLSGDVNTLQQLINIINAIATPQFIEKYEFLNNNLNKSTDKIRYIKYLAQWNLSSGLILVNNESVIISKITDNNRLIRIFNQPIFKNGAYNIDRFNALKSLLS